MKKTLLFTALSVIIPATMFASGKVTVCPGVGALQSVPFNYAEEVNGTWEAGVYRDNFNTDFSWLFLIEGINAQDEASAIKTGNEVVQHMSFMRGPIHMISGGYVYDYCEYLTEQGLEAYAYTFENSDFQFPK